MPSFAASPSAARAAVSGSASFPDRTAASRRLLRPLAALLLLPLLAVGCATRVDPATADAVPESVREVVRQAVDQGHRTGVVVGLVNGTGAHTFAYTGDGAATLTADSVFAVGSLAKVMTGVLLADMVERGEVSLDDPVNRYLPADLAIPAAGGVELTLRHLATHTSGLPKEATGFAWEAGGPEAGGPEAGGPEAGGPEAGGLNAGGASDPDAIVRFLRDFDRPRPAGAAYEYSNLGMALLGRVLEHRAGKPLAELVAERVTAPLGLDDTGYDLAAAGSRLATPHAGPDAMPAARLAVPAAAHAAGGLYTTAADLLRFVAANLAAADGEADGAAAGEPGNWRGGSPILI